MLRDIGVDPAIITNQYTWRICGSQELLGCAPVSSGSVGGGGGGGCGERGHYTHIEGGATHH